MAGKHSILSFNVNGVNKKWLNIISLINTHQPIILFIIEPNIKRISQIRKIPNYSSILNTHTDSKLNLLAFTNNKYDITHIANHQTVNTNLTHLSLMLNNMKINAVGMYIKSSTNITDNINIPTGNTILIGDLNARHLEFGDTTTNTAGRKLKSFTNKHNLHLINKDDPFTFQQHFNDKNIYSKIDLAFATPNLLNKGITSNTLPDEGSDHLPLIVAIGARNPPKVLTYKNYNKAEWLGFSQQISYNIPNLPTPTPEIPSINNSIKSLTNLIISASDKHIPNSKTKLKHTIEDSQTIKELKHQRNKINRIIYNNKHIPHPNLINMKNRISKTIRLLYIHASIDKQNTYIKKLNNPKKDHFYWNEINNIINTKPKSENISPLLDNNGILHTSTHGKLNVFQNHYKESFKPINTQQHPEHLNITQTVNTFLNPNNISTETLPETTTETIINIIKKAKHKSAPGPDNIPNILLKHLPYTAIEYITDIFNNCLKISYFPNSWKTSTITNILKPGKNAQLPSSYRPISLLSTLGKILEHVLNTYVHNHIRQHSIIRDSQHGFMPMRGTADALISLIEHMSAGTQTTNKWAISACFFDMQKAFDTVWHNALIYTLIQYNFPQALIRMLSSFLQNRNTRIKLDNTLSHNVHIKAGVPQGSVLAPTLYILFINSFPSFQIPNPNTIQTQMNKKRHIFQYADDTTIALSAATEHATQACLEQWLQQIITYCTKYKIQINPTKSVQLFFKNTNRRHRQITPLNFNNDLIPIKQSTKYLGIRINEHLTWNAEINNRIHLARLHKKTLRNLKIQGINTKTLINIYKSKIRPLLTHTAPILGLINTTQKRKLETTERAILQEITRPLGTYRKIRTETLYEKANITPISTFIHQQIRRYLIKKHNTNTLQIQYTNSPIFHLYTNHYPEGLAPPEALEQQRHPSGI